MRDVVGGGSERAFGAEAGEPTTGPGGFRRVPALPADQPKRSGAPGRLWWTPDPTLTPTGAADRRVGAAMGGPGGETSHDPPAVTDDVAAPPTADPPPPAAPAAELPAAHPPATDAPPDSLAADPPATEAPAAHPPAADAAADSLAADPPTTIPPATDPPGRDLPAADLPAADVADRGVGAAMGGSGDGKSPDLPARGRGERRRWAVAPLVALAVVTGVCTAAAPTASLPGPWGGVTATSTGLARSTPDEVQRLAGVRKLLDARAAALLRRDRAGWLAGVDPAATTLRTRQAAALANIAKVPLAAWRYEIEPEHQRGRAEPGRWTVQVTLHYALRAVDPAPTERPLMLTFARRGDRWLLNADTATGADGTRTWRGPWEHGPLEVRRGKHSLVLAHPKHAGRLAAFAAGVDAAVPRVRQALGGRAPAAVAVLIPDDQREMSQLVGERLALGKIAAVAVADSVDPGTGQARGQRVVVNPANLDRLGSLGRRVVLQHEVTHVATRGITGPGTPIWLVEGLADWIGYRDSGLPPRMVGDELRGQLRSGRWPGRLPTQADFRGDSPRLSVAYEEAWTACTLIADRAGPSALVKLYRAVGTADDPSAAVDAQLRATLGLSYPQFVAEWRRSVRADFG